MSRDRHTATESAAEAHAAAEAYHPTRRELAEAAGFVDEPPSKRLECPPWLDDAITEAARRAEALRAEQMERDRAWRARWEAS